MKTWKLCFICVLCGLGFVLLFFNFAGAEDIDPAALGIKLPIPGSGGGAAIGGSLKAAGASAGVEALKTAGWAIAVYGFLYLLSQVLYYFITLGYGLLNTAVNTALDPNWFQFPAVQSAWQTVRDFVNVWFILVFLAIAIGTILRVSNYQAKKLLPTLILVALVVNFSLPISGFVIDISNIIAFQFFNAICTERTDESGAKVCDFSKNLENGLFVRGFSAIIETTVKGVEESKLATPPPNNPGSFLLPEKAHAFAPAIAAVAARFIASAAFTSLVTEALNALVITTIGAVSLKAFIGLFVTDVFLLFTLFVIMAIAILFLIRIISLIFIVVLSPFGFAATVLPSTQKFANDWWEHLFKQSFFAPFALLFLWMSLNMMNAFRAALIETKQSLDYTNPANANLLFFIFSIVLLYSSLWIAKRMGAVGAETIMNWSKWIKSAATGFVGGIAGGIAARTLAPIGTAITAGGVPEAVGKKWWLGGALGGVRAKEFAEWLQKRGGAPADAAAKAELGMRLAPADRAKYFAGLDMAAKEAMLRKMKAEERESMFANLSPAETETARQILRSGAFAPEERASAEVEEFQRRSAPDQWTQFGTLSDEAQKNFLTRFTDDDRRAEFLAKVKEKDSGAAQKANNFLEKDMRFTAGQQFGYKKARWKQELLAEDRKDNLAGFLDGITDSQLKENYFKTMDDRQRLAVMEKWHSEGRPLNEFVELLNKLKPEEQDKFYRETVGRRATAPALVGLINAVPEDKDKKKILSATTAEQLARVATANPLIRPMADEIAESGTMAERNRQTYYRNQGRVPPRRPGGPGGPAPGAGPAPTPVTPVTPVAPATPTVTPTPTPTPTTPRAVTLSDEIDRINLLDRTRNANAIQFAIDELSKEPEFRKLRKKINILTEFEFVEKGKTPRELMEFLQREIPLLTETEIHYKIDAKTLANSTVKELVLQKANTKQLGRLVLDPERAKIIKEHLYNPDNFYESGVGTSVVERIAKERNTTSYGARNIILKDPELYSEAIAEMFEQGYKNKELAKTLSRISKTPKENLTNPGEIRIKERLFE